jgi:quercetin dioxygenase-like cupin family protein
MLGVAAAAISMAARNSELREIHADTIRKQPLPAPFSGWEARFVVVQFPAGVRSLPHRHAGFVLGYVFEGEFRFALNGEPPSVLTAGSAFYEPPGAEHSVGESAGARQPARILAIIIAPVEEA